MSWHLSSVQDCSFPGHGCDGGDALTAIQALVSNGAADLDTQDPYVEKPSTCKYGPSGQPRPSATSYAIDPEGATVHPDENKIGILLAQHGSEIASTMRIFGYMCLDADAPCATCFASPLPVAVDATAIQHYSGKSALGSDVGSRAACVVSMFI